MGHSMLGPHINWKADQIPWLRRAKPRVAKVILQNVDRTWMQEARDASPDTLWVGRLIVHPQVYNSPETDAANFANNLLLPAAEPFRGIIDALEGYNEIGFSPFPSNEPGGFLRILSSVLRATLQPRSPLRVRPRLDAKFWSWSWQFAKRCNSTAMIQSGHDIQPLLKSSMRLYEELVTAREIDCDWTQRGLLFVYKNPVAFERYGPTDELLARQFGEPALRGN